MASLEGKEAAPSSSEKVKATQVQAWLEALTDTKCNGTLQAYLKDGIILCQAMNKIVPNKIRIINTQHTPFKEMENISFYLKACKDVGVRENDLFMTRDLYENANMTVVINNIWALGGVAQTLSDFSGPYCGIRADEGRRDFKFKYKQFVKDDNAVGGYTYVLMNQAQAARPVAQAPSAVGSFTPGMHNLSSMASITSAVATASATTTKTANLSLASVRTRKDARPTHCGECGAHLGVDLRFKFCGECGTKIPD